MLRQTASSTLFSSTVCSHSVTLVSTAISTPACPALCMFAFAPPFSHQFHPSPSRASTFAPAPLKSRERPLDRPSHPRKRTRPARAPPSAAVLIPADRRRLGRAETFFGRRREASHEATEPTGDSVLKGIRPSTPVLFMAAKIIANLIVLGSGVVLRAVSQAYRQAIVNASKTGVAQETVQNMVHKSSKSMTVHEARQVLGVSEYSSWEEIMKKYDHLFERNAKSGSFYLQSKVHRAKECLEAIKQDVRQESS